MRLCFLVLALTANAARAGLDCPKWVALSAGPSPLAAVVEAYRDLIVAPHVPTQTIAALYDGESPFEFPAVETSELGILRDTLSTIERFAHSQKVDKAALNAALEGVLYEGLFQRGVDLKRKLRASGLLGVLRTQAQPTREWESGPVDELKFMVDGQALLRTCYETRSLSRVEIATNRKTSLGYPLWDEANETSPLSVKAYRTALSPDGKRIYVAGRGQQTVGIVDAQTMKKTGELENIIARFVALSADGSLLATSFDRTTQVWEMSPSGRVGALVSEGPGVTRSFTADGAYAIVRKHGLGNSPLFRRLRGNEDKFWDVNLSMLSAKDHRMAIGGPYLAIGHADSKRIVLREWESGALVLQLEAPTYMEGSTGFTKLLFSPDLSQVAAATDQGRIFLWDRESGDLLAVWQAHEKLDELLFSPDGKTLVSYRHDGKEPVKLWNVPAVLEGD